MNKRILCVEDHDDMSDLISFFLNSHGYETVSVSTGDEGLSLAQTQHFDLYLLDVALPGISGIEICKQIRQSDSSTPIVFCSAGAREVEQQRGLAAGAQAYLVKPVEVDMILETVEKLIGVRTRG